MIARKQSEKKHTHTYTNENRQNDSSTSCSFDLIAHFHEKKKCEKLKRHGRISHPPSHQRVFYRSTCVCVYAHTAVALAIRHSQKFSFTVSRLPFLMAH